MAYAAIGLLPFEELVEDESRQLTGSTRIHKLCKSSPCGYGSSARDEVRQPSPPRLNAAGSHGSVIALAGLRRCPDCLSCLRQKTVVDLVKKANSGQEADSRFAHPDARRANRNHPFTRHNFTMGTCGRRPRARSRTLSLLMKERIGSPTSFATPKAPEFPSSTVEMTTDGVTSGLH